MSEENLQTLYSCPICLQIPPDEIYECVNKHITCKDCFSKITECPQCRLPLKGSASRNTELEALLSAQTFPCPNAEAGCTLMLSRDQIGGHLEECGFKEVVLQLCQLLDLSCCDVYSSSKDIKALVKHLKEVHGVTVISEYKQAVITLEKFFDVQINKTRLWRPLIFGDFLIVPKLNGTQQSLSFVCVHLSETSVKAEDYVVSYSISGTGQKLKPLRWTTTVCGFDQIQTALNFPMLQIPGTILQQSCADGGSLKIVVVVELESQRSKFPGPQNNSTEVTLPTKPVVETDETADDRNLEYYTSDDAQDGVGCDGCGMRPLSGIRYNCLQCADYDLCVGCRRSGKHGKHVFTEIQNDLERLAVAKMKYDEHLAHWKPLLADDVVVETSQLCCECASGDGKQKAVLLCRACPKFYGVCLECFREGRCQTKCEKHPWMLTKDISLK